MLTFDERSDFSFLSVSDETRTIFRTYSAVCPPGFFAGFNTLLPKAQIKGDALQRSPILPEVQSSLLLQGT
jgi:hypothetical protein